MNRKNLPSVILLFLLLAGCGLHEREQRLTQQEQTLREQQQELILQANQLALKENQLDARARQLDSAKTQSNLLATTFPKLAGRWDVNMICSKATCSGSAVGDTKNEQWLINLQDSSIIAQAFTKNTLTRVYAGTYKDGLLQLNAQAAGSVADPSVQINVFLRPTGDSLSMDGKRTISRPNCQIVYNLTMKKL